MKNSLLLVLVLLIGTSCRRPTSDVAMNTTLISQEVESNSKSPYSIAIDAGHGGKDPGSKSSIFPYTPEKTINLKTALKVANFLRQKGYQVSMTRSNDSFISLQERTLIAKRKNCNLFVSIHYNHAKNKDASGIEIYYYKDKKNLKRSELSKKLGESILSKVIPATNSVSRGVHHGNLHVIRNTIMPAVLVEAGFLSNRKEAVRLKNPHYIHKLAWGIAKGIEEFIKTNPQ